MNRRHALRRYLGGLVPRPRSPLVVSVQFRRGRMTREEWLGHAVEALRPLLGDVGVAFPAHVLVSVGFGERGRRSSQADGVCYSRYEAANYRTQIYVSPTIDHEIGVLCVLLHELIHCSDDCASGHRGHFARVHRAVGFEGRATCSEPSNALWAALNRTANELIRAVGRYPHAALNYYGGY